MKQIDKETLQRVTNVLSSTFKLDSSAITEATTLDSLPGWDSLGHITLMMEIEREFAVRIPTHRVNEPKTIADLAQLVAEFRAPPRGDGQTAS